MTVLDRPDDLDPSLQTRPHLPYPAAAAAAAGSAALLVAALATITTAVPVTAVAAVGLCVAALVPAGRGLVALQAARRALLAPGGVLEARASADRARSQALRGTGVAGAGLVVLAVLALVRSNDGAVLEVFFRWDLMATSVDEVLGAFGVNVVIALASAVLIVVWSLLLAVVRVLPGPAAAPLRALAVAYVDLFRSIPVVVVIYLVGFGLPLTGLPLLGSVSPVWFAVLALSLSYGAYVSETFRSGIESVHASQVAAARSLGLSHAQTLASVVLPQAFRTVTPALMTWFIALQKDTALVGFVGVVDSFAQARFSAAGDFNLSAVTLVSILFVVVTIPQARIVDHLAARRARRTSAAHR